MGKKYSLTVLFLLICFASLNAAFVKTFNYNESKINFRKIDNYDYVEYSDLEHTLREGAPSLPVDISEIIYSRPERNHKYRNYFN